MMNIVYMICMRIIRKSLIIFNWRRLIRKVTGRPVLNVAMISNYRDQTDMQMAGYSDEQKQQNVLNLVPFYFGKIAAQVMLIQVLSKDLLEKETIRKAQVLFMEAVNNAVQGHGTKVILLAASTKRLFGRDAVMLKKRFPSTIFTIGDNFTSVLLCEEVKRAIQNTGLKSLKVLVIGPSGLLGREVIKYLLEKNYHVIGLGSDNGRAVRTSNEFGIYIVDSFEKVGEVDLIVACTHISKSVLDEEKIEKLRKKNRKLIVIDVCEPPNLTKEVYDKCRNRVIRVDAGNGYSFKLKYAGGFLGYKSLRLSRNVAWGCFCEAMIIANHIEDPDISSANWMEVSVQNKKIIRKYFNKDFGLSSYMLCFGKKIGSFDIHCIERDTNSIRPVKQILHLRDRPL